MMEKESYSALPAPVAAARPERKRRNIFSKVAAGLLLYAGWQLFVVSSSSSFQEPQHVDSVFSSSARAPLIRGLQECQRLRKPLFNATYAASRERTNPRFIKGTKSTLIRNARVLTGDSSEYPAPWGERPVDVILKEGLITYIGPTEDIPADLLEKDQIEINARGRYLTPGLFDLHSHAGVDSFPALWATSDTNEIFSSDTSYVRVLDAFNPSDEGLQIIKSGGVTTSLILPGSANNMGGEAIVVKHRPVSTISTEDMLITASESSDDARHYRYMKMACGENPKRVYGQGMPDSPSLPFTRMGEAWVFRSNFERARKHKEEQDAWCEKAEQMGVSSADSAMADRLPAFPESLELDSLTALLRGEVKLNVHCYETMDLEAMVRHSLEFDFPIAAFHHALDAYRVPEIIKRAKTNISAAIFSSHWGYKKEAYQGSVYGPKILAENGIPVIIKSDHPVTNAQNLIYQAQEAHHYGLAEGLAMASVTSEPAKAAGLDYRIGYLRDGYDADVVLWNMHPLQLGATPVNVWIDGISQFEMAKDETTEEAEQKAPIVAFPAAEKCTDGSVSVLFVNASKIFLDSETLTATTDGLSMLISNGKIACVGSGTSCASTSASIKVVDLHGEGYILPGLTAVGVRLGISEIDAEDATGDGSAGEFDYTNPAKVTYAKDSLIFDGKRLDRAHAAGVLSSITPPLSNFIVRGVSTTFATGAHNVLEEGAIAKEVTALHVQIGASHRNSMTPTIASQIAGLREILDKGLVNSTTLYGQVAYGKLPIAIHAGNKDVIAKLILLKKEFEKKSEKELKMIIVGGQESYLVATELAAANVPVILYWRCMPNSWELRHCLTGPPYQDSLAITILAKAGVMLGLAQSDDSLAHQLAWEAGWAVKSSEGELSERQGIDLVSRNIQRIFGVEKKAGLAQDKDTLAEFVVYDKSPLEFGGSIVAVMENGMMTRC